MMMACYWAAEPAAGSAGSIGVFGKTAEGGDPVKETGRRLGGYRMGVFALRANREALFFPSENQSAKGMLAASAGKINHRHGAAIAEHGWFVNSVIQRT